MVELRTRVVKGLKKLSPQPIPYPRSKPARAAVRGRISDGIGYALSDFLFESVDLGNALVGDRLTAIILRHRPHRRPSSAHGEDWLNASRHHRHAQKNRQAPDNIRHPSSPSARTALKWGAPQDFASSVFAS